MSSGDSTGEQIGFCGGIFLVGVDEFLFITPSPLKKSNVLNFTMKYLAFVFNIFTEVFD